MVRSKGLLRGQLPRWRVRRGGEGVGGGGEGVRWERGKVVGKE